MKAPLFLLVGFLGIASALYPRLSRDIWADNLPAETSSCPCSSVKAGHADRESCLRDYEPRLRQGESALTKFYKDCYNSCLTCYDSEPPQPTASEMEFSRNASPCAPNSLSGCVIAPADRDRLAGRIDGEQQKYSADIKAIRLKIRGDQKVALDTLKQFCPEFVQGADIQEDFANYMKATRYAGSLKLIAANAGQDEIGNIQGEILGLLGRWKKHDSLLLMQDRRRESESFRSQHNALVGKVHSLCFMNETYKMLLASMLKGPQRPPSQPSVIQNRINKIPPLEAPKFQ